MNAEVIGEMSRITRKCIRRIHDLLANQGIADLPTVGLHIDKQPRGGLHFVRFLPEETLFQLLPGFPKYFQASRQCGLISNEEAYSLVRRLIALGASLRGKYTGHLLTHLRNGVVGEFLDSALDTRTLGLLEATEEGFPDLLHEQLPLPCVVEDYLMAREFSSLRLDYSVVSKIAANPIRALIAGLGVVRVGHWLGLTTEEINKSLEILEAGEQENTAPGEVQYTKEYGEKVVIPIFVLGFQGTIAGFFCNLNPEQKMNVRNILEQTGRCLGERYALERRLRLQKLLGSGEPTAKIIAQVAIQIASPVEHLVVTRGGEQHAYRICKEADYLAGYEQWSGASSEPLKRDPDNESLYLHALDPPAQIHFKTLHDCTALDDVIHALRIKTALAGFFSTAMTANLTEPAARATNGFSALHPSELDRVIITLEHQFKTSPGRRAAAKHLCFFEIVKDELLSRELRLTNAQMQTRMSAKLNAAKVTGYQVTGEALKKFETEIHEILPQRFHFEPLSSKVIRIIWH